MSYTYQYPHPAVTADCVVFGLVEQELQVLLIERGNDPYKGCWAFPGGFMNMDETAEECARRAQWFPVGEMPQLAFDHDLILRDALQRLQGDIHQSNRKL